MKAIYIMLFTVFFVPQVFGQSNTNISIVNEKVFGKDFINSKDIKGTEIQFDERVESFYVDTTSNLITIQFRGLSKDGKWKNNSGKLALYDPLNKKILWTTKLNYATHSIVQYDDILLKIELFYISNGPVPFRASRLDMKNGTELWKLKNTFNYIDAKKKIGLISEQKQLTAIDLVSGKEIWNRSQKIDYYSNEKAPADLYREKIPLNDSIITMIASGLHTFNLKTGRGWDYELTNNKKVQLEFSKRVAGVVNTTLTAGIIPLPDVYSHVMTHIQSNVLFDNHKIYFASLDKLLCFNLDGQVIWETKLPADWTSKSHLFIKDNLLYMINRGMAINELYETVPFGVPYIASFDIQNGVQKKITELKDIQKVDALALQDKYVIVSSENNLVKYDLSDSDLYYINQLDENETGKIKLFIGDLRFSYTDSFYTQTNDFQFRNLFHDDSGNQYILTDKDKAIAFDESLKNIGEIKQEDLFIQMNHSDKCKLVCGTKDESKAVILNKNNKKIVEVEANSTAIILNHFLYDYKDNTIRIIDLRDLLKD